VAGRTSVEGRGQRQFRQRHRLSCRRLRARPSAAPFNLTLLTQSDVVARPRRRTITLVPGRVRSPWSARYRVTRVRSTLTASRGVAVCCVDSPSPGVNRAGRLVRQQQRARDSCFAGALRDSAFGSTRVVSVIRTAPMVFFPGAGGCGHLLRRFQMTCSCLGVARLDGPGTPRLVGVTNLPSVGEILTHQRRWCGHRACGSP